MTFRLRAVAAALTVGVVACGSATDDPLRGSDTTRDAGDESPSLGGSFGDDPSRNEPSDGCSDEARFVYVVTHRNALYRFAPDKLAFTLVGDLACAAGSATPNSMAVDRSGTAWVNYTDGRLFKVSTKDASCESTSFEPNQFGFGRFGMAFASNAAGSEEETLFVSGLLGSDRGVGLASIDLDTMKLTPIGDYDGPLAGFGAELTGTGDGKLYGFFTTSPRATLAEIDKSSAATSSRLALDGVNTGQAWAFSFWGGDVWFYTTPGDAPSSVTRLAKSEQDQISVVVDNVGDMGRIVGAGVSTCAPTTPPK